jgi:hypothetical protein
MNNVKIVATFHEASLDTNTDTYNVIGKVTNQGNQKATFAKVSGAFYNSNNTIIAADFAYTSPQDLEPGETAPFNIIADTPADNEITSSSLNVHSKQYSFLVR